MEQLRVVRFDPSYGYAEFLDNKYLIEEASKALKDAYITMEQIPYMIRGRIYVTYKANIDLDRWDNDISSDDKYKINRIGYCLERLTEIATFAQRTGEENLSEKFGIAITVSNGYTWNTITVIPVDITTGMGPVFDGLSDAINGAKSSYRYRYCVGCRITDSTEGLDDFVVGIEKSVEESEDSKEEAKGEVNEED